MKTPTREQSNVISRFIGVEKILYDCEQKMLDLREEFKEKFGENLDEFYG